MLYQLPNGKTIYITIEEYFNLTKEEEQFLVMHGYGEVMNNPFSQSVISKGGNKINEDDDMYSDSDDDSCGDFLIDSIDDGLDIPDDCLNDDFSD